MAGLFERSYGRAFKAAIRAVNPIKKRVMKTECLVHQFINNQSIIILKSDGHNEACDLLSRYMEYMNRGVVWADQDLKSGNHFYNPKSQRGLFGFSNALKECMTYYSAALTLWKRGDIKRSIFYLGASCHLVQDVTVPQHVNVRLLKHHRKYELWVVRTYNIHDRFSCDSGGIYMNTIREFIDENARVAMDAYDRSKHEKKLEDRFFTITDTILCQAQRSTAGFLYMFYKDIKGMGGIDMHHVQRAVEDI